jgi:hypothetical protein
MARGENRQEMIHTKSEAKEKLSGLDLPSFLRAQ